MALIMGSLFVGISYLAQTVDARPFTSGNPTVISQITKYVLGPSPLGTAGYLLVQAATLLILVLAANTSFSGFPLLASFAAAHARCPDSSASAATGWCTPTASSRSRRSRSCSSSGSTPRPPRCCRCTRSGW
jgi:hypothetical protein